MAGLLAALAVFLQVLLSASLPEAKVSLQMPEGWRQLQPPEAQKLKPRLRPDNKLLEKLNEERPADTPLVLMKHDYPLDTVAANVQLFATRLPKKLHGASSIETARVIAAGARFAFHGTYEVEPREIVVADRPAAEWVTRYELVESSGTRHDMRSRIIVITAPGDRAYHLGYAGPAADTADFEAFDAVVRSLKIERKAE